MSLPDKAQLPVAVIGGGPVGLAAAAHLVTRGVAMKLYEAGETVAANVRDWGHVRLFSPWGFNSDGAATAILRRHGWQAPPAAALPTGHDLYAAYLQPLAATPELARVIETGVRVRNVARDGRSLIYAARYETMNGLLAYLTENCCAGVAGCAPAACAPPAARRKTKPKVLA